MKTLFILLITVLCYSCATHKQSHNVKWEDNIHNPENEEFVTELAFNLEISKDKVTQEDFNNRYIYNTMENKPVEVTHPNCGSSVQISEIVPESTKR